MSSNIPNRNLFDGNNSLYGQNSDGFAPGFSLYVTGNNTTVSVALHNPDGVSCQVEMARIGSNVWVPVGEVVSESKIYYMVWMNDFIYRVRLLSASGAGVTVRVRNNHDYPLEHTNGGFLDTEFATGAIGPHTHTLADITDSGTAAGLNVPATLNSAATPTEVVRGDDPRLYDDSDDLPSGIAAPAPAPLVAGGSVQAQLLALAAAYDPFDSSHKPINIAGLAPAINTIPAEVSALTGDDAEPGDTVTGIFDDFSVEYQRNTAGTAWVEVDRRERAQGDDYRFDGEFTAADSPVILTAAQFANGSYGALFDTSGGNIDVLIPPGLPGRTHFHGSQLSADGNHVDFWVGTSAADIGAGQEPIRALNGSNVLQASEPDNGVREETGAHFTIRKNDSATEWQQVVKQGGGTSTDAAKANVIHMEQSEYDALTTNELIMCPFIIISDSPAYKAAKYDASTNTIHQIGDWS